MLKGKFFSLSYPRRSFGLDSTTTLSAGEVILDSSNNVEGIYNGSSVISVDVLKTAMNLYFNSQAQIIRPSFGFNYSIITQNDSQLADVPQGALVKAAAAASPAHFGGAFTRRYNYICS